MLKHSSWWFIVVSQPCVLTFHLTILLCFIFSGFKLSRGTTQILRHLWILWNPSTGGNRHQMIGSPGPQRFTACQASPEPLNSNSELRRLFVGTKQSDLELSGTMGVTQEWMVYNGNSRLGMDDNQGYRGTPMETYIWEQEADTLIACRQAWVELGERFETFCIMLVF